MVGDLRMWLGRDQTRQPTQMRRPPTILTEHPDQPGRSILSSSKATERPVNWHREVTDKDVLVLLGQHAPGQAVPSARVR